MDVKTERDIFNSLENLRRHKEDWHLLAIPRASATTISFYVPYDRRQISKVIRKYESILTFRVNEEYYKPRFYTFN